VQKREFPGRISIRDWEFCPIGLWEDGDKLQIAALRLTDVARQFYNWCLEFHSAGATWQKFKDEFRRRFCDTHTDQYHFMKRHTARQGRNETPRSFLRDVGLCHKNLSAKWWPCGSAHPQRKRGPNASSQFCGWFSGGSRSPNEIFEPAVSRSVSENFSYRPWSGKAGKV